MSDITRWPPRKPRPTDRTPEERAQLRAKGRKEGVAQHYQRWTPDDIGHMRRLSRTHTRAEVAAIIGRTPRALAAKAGELGISFLRWGERSNLTRHSAATVQKIAQMEKDGVHPEEIAREFGTTPDYVYRIASRVRRWHDIKRLDLP
jgi:hypothetical protein